MYKVTTGEARTDLYGLGKGDAQVFDFSAIERRNALNQQLAAQEKAAKQKQDQAREDEIMNNLAVASKVAIRPNDQKYFAEQQQGLYDYVEKNIDKLRKGDASATMEFQRMFGKLNTEAEISKNAREFAEAEFQKYNANPNKYRVGSDKVIGDFIAAPEYAGNWDVSKIPLKENIDYMGRIKSTLNPIVDDIMVKNPIKSTYSEADAKELIKNDLMSDPRLMDQANYEFENATDKELKSLGLTRDADPIEFAAIKYSPYLKRDVTGSAFYTGFGDGNTPKKPQLVATTKITDTSDPGNNWESIIDYADKSDPYQNFVRKGKDGKEYSQDVKVTKFIKRGDKTVVQVATKPAEGSEGKGEVFEVDYDQGGKELLRKMGVDNPFTLQTGKGTPENISVQTYSEKKKGSEARTAPKMSQAEWNKQWANLKKGQSMKGLDGKTYTKK